jgi:DNA repair and recombination RAD54-like protein
VNTLAHWDNEVTVWTGNLDTPLLVDNLSGLVKSERKKAIKRWVNRGGILLLGEQLFQRLTREPDSEVKDELLKTDILVLDEAHTMLKNSANKVFQALAGVETKRRILLTGTPLTNNVTEYFRMVQFACPGAIEGINTESEFEKVYR